MENTEQQNETLTNLNLDEIIDESATDLADDKKENLEEVKEILQEPPMTSPEWQDFVLKQFEPNETDPEGNPYVAALRRVVRLVLGPIILSKAHVVQAPNYRGGENNSILCPATVEHTIKILCCKIDPPLNPESPAYEIEFTEVADVYFGNTDAEYARHPSAMASTRAEGRCLRKALQLQKVIAAEENTKVPLEEAAVNGMITPTQKNFIVILCQRCNIDVMKYINSGAKQYKDIDCVPMGTAIKMTEHLSALQNDMTKIKQELKPYSENWRIINE